MLNIVVNLSTRPIKCEACGKSIRTGHRVVTNGKHNFDTCECEAQFKNVH